MFAAKRLPWQISLPINNDRNALIDDINNKATALAEAIEEWVDAVETFFDKTDPAKDPLSDLQKADYRNNIVAPYNASALLLRKGGSNFRLAYDAIIEIVVKHNNDLIQAAAEADNPDKPKRHRTNK